MSTGCSDPSLLSGYLSKFEVSFGARKAGTIGFSAIRGGDIVGEHDVIFAGMGERVILRHVATDRTVFARGALRAALWGQGRKPGQYDMMDVLGI